MSLNHENKTKSIIIFIIQIIWCIALGTVLLNACSRLEVWAIKPFGWILTVLTIVIVFSFFEMLKGNW